MWQALGIQEWTKQKHTNIPAINEVMYEKCQGQQCNREKIKAEEKKWSGEAFPMRPLSRNLRVALWRRDTKSKCQSKELQGQRGWGRGRESVGQEVRGSGQLWQCPRLGPLQELWTWLQMRLEVTKKFWVAQRQNGTMFKKITLTWEWGAGEQSRETT